MSAGELESGNAGEPAKLIRQRYREASDVIKKGKVRGRSEVLREGGERGVEAEEQVFREGSGCYVTGTHKRA
jgi:hypothetical protein